MRLKKEHMIVGAILILTFAIRLYLSFQTSYFAGDDSYFNIRQIEHIRSSGFPLFKDDLSYSGRVFIFPPVYHYIAAFFSLFMPLEIVVKIVTNLFASAIVIFVFLISFHITRNFMSSVLASLASGFVPIFFSSTFTSSATYSLAVPLFFFAFYCFLKSEENRNYVYVFLTTIFLLVLVHSIVIFLIIGLLFYLLLIKLEHLKQSKQEIEMIIFSSLLILWFQFLFYKKALLTHGITIVWQNIPAEIINTFFRETNLLEMVYQIGLIPFFFGIYVIYRTTFEQKRKSILLVVGFVLSLGISIWLRIIKPEIGLTLLGLMLVILLSDYLKGIFEYIEKTRISKFKFFIILFVALAIVATSILPSIYYSMKELDNVPGSEEINAMKWMKSHTAENAVVLATAEEGHLVTYFGNRKNVIDSNFLMIPDAQERYEDIKTIYTSSYSTVATPLLNKYDVNYLIFSEKSKKDFEINELKIAQDTTCFNLIYNKTILIYKSLCKVIAYREI